MVDCCSVFPQLFLFLVFCPCDHRFPSFCVLLDLPNLDCCQHSRVIVSVCHHSFSLPSGTAKEDRTFSVYRSFPPTLSEIRHRGRIGRKEAAGSLKRARESSSAGSVVTTGASAAALAVHAFALRTTAATSSRSGRRTRQLPRFPCRPAVWRPYRCSRFRPPGTPGPA